jgi:hypothetical protein
MKELIVVHKIKNMLLSKIRVNNDASRSKTPQMSLWNSSVVVASGGQYFTLSHQSDQSPIRVRVVRSESE